MLTNYQLLDYCKKNDIKLDWIDMKDKLDKTRHSNLIINLESSSEGCGTHWVALINEKEEWFYFDSFGAYPPRHVVSYVKQFKPKSFGYNNFIIQNLQSEQCGSFCKALLGYVQKHNGKFYDKINSFINEILDDTKQNDSILKRIISKL
jgi:hypothetical protein